jgi:hypothetical protein
MDQYQSPRVSCGLSDFEAVLEEFRFLDYPDGRTDGTVLQFYSSELNHRLNLELFCLVNIFFGICY